MEIFVFLVVWLVFGVVGAMIMSGKGRSGCGGFALGVLLGPIGLIVALLLRPSEQNEALRQLRIEQIKRGITGHEDDAEHSDTEPLLGMNIEWAIFPLKGSRYRWGCQLCGRNGAWTSPRDEVVRQFRNHHCSRLERPTVTQSKSQGKKPPDRSLTDGIVLESMRSHFRWKCANCGEHGLWTDRDKARTDSIRHSCV